MEKMFGNFGSVSIHEARQNHFKIAEDLPSTEKRGIHFSAEDQSA